MMTRGGWAEVHVRLRVVIVVALKKTATTIMRRQFNLRAPPEQGHILQ
jgi:hypothetical protein